MYKSVITIKCYLDKYFGDGKEEKPWIWIEEMFIPQALGIIKKGFTQTLKHIKQLPLGSRYRGDVRV